MHRSVRSKGTDRMSLCRRQCAKPASLLETRVTRHVETLRNNFLRNRKVCYLVTKCKTCLITTTS